MEIKIKIQDDIYQQAKNKLGDEFDKFIEEQCKTAANMRSQKEEEILKKISQHQNKLMDLQVELIKEQNKNQSQVNTSLLDDAMKIINRIHEKLGCIGENQLKSISNTKNVPFLSVLNHCKKEGLTIVPFNEVPKR